MKNSFLLPICIWLCFMQTSAEVLYVRGEFDVLLQWVKLSNHITLTDNEGCPPNAFLCPWSKAWKGKKFCFPCTPNWGNLGNNLEVENGGRERRRNNQEELQGWGMVPQTSSKVASWSLPPGVHAFIPCLQYGWALWLTSNQQDIPNLWGEHCLCCLWKKNCHCYELPVEDAVWREAYGSPWPTANWKVRY